jgi:RES domain-containing protein
MRRPYSKQPLDGEGAYRFGGRWSSVGTRLTYTAEHLSLAIIEYFVQIDADDSPRDLVVVTADIPASVSRIAISEKQLPGNWRRIPAAPGLAAIGDGFVSGGRAAVLIVPSVIAPAESNWLVNSRHPDVAKIVVNAPEKFRYDARFFQ